MSLTYYFLPTRNVFGEGAVNEAGKLMKSLDGTHPMIVTDAFLAKSGMADQVKKILEDEGLPTYIFGVAEPNPTDKNVVAGVAAFKEQGCDSIISLGGGSSHDCAKAIGLIAANGGEIYDYEGIDISKNKMVPLMAINTTAGTASEITRFCIITDTRRKVKMAILDWRVTPQIAINDPVLMKGMPPRLTAATGMDALTHAVEAYIGKSNVKSTEHYAELATRLIYANIEEVYNNGKNIEARNAMLKASYYAGMAFTRAYVGYVHAIAHNLGGFYGVPHGLANAIILPYVLEYYGETAHARLAKLAVISGVKTDGTDAEKAEAFIESIKQLNRNMNIPDKFDMIKEEDIPTIVKRALKEGNPLYPVPKIMDEADCEAVIRRMMK